MTSRPRTPDSGTAVGRVAVRIVRSAPEHAVALEELQRVCFPGLAEDERMKAEHFLEHQQRFPDGEFVALARSSPDGSSLANERVVGLGSGFLTDFDLDRPDHAFIDIIAGGTYANHDPQGAWYYGADISVHPDYRGHGIGGRLYRARQGLVRRLGRKGIVAGGALPGYRHHRDSLSVEEYVAKIAAGELHDPTLGFQIANGFEVLGVIRDYMTDEPTGNTASLIVWRNPDPLPDGYRMRHARPEDAGAVAALIARRQLVELGTVEATEATVLDDWAGIDLTTDTVLVERDGVLRACADLLIRPGQVSAYAYVDPELADAATRRELGAYLAAWSEARGYEELRAAANQRAAEEPLGHSQADTGVVIRRYVVAADEETVALLEERGYAFQRSVLWMERDLASAPAGALAGQAGSVVEPAAAVTGPAGPVAGQSAARARALPAGLRLRTYRGELDEPAAHQAFEAGSLDMNGRAPNTLDQWRSYVGTRDPNLVFIVETDPEPGAAGQHEASGGIVALLVASVSRPPASADTDAQERQGEVALLGHVDSLRVVRPWRRRGIGAVLLERAFTELAARGATSVGLSVDAASPTGAPNLYLHAGMHVTRRYLVMETTVTEDG